MDSIFVTCIPNKLPLVVRFTIVEYSEQVLQNFSRVSPLFYVFLM